MRAKEAEEAAPEAPTVEIPPEKQQLIGVKIAREAMDYAMQRWKENDKSEDIEIAARR
jgi:hypothetical protein